MMKFAAFLLALSFVGFGPAGCKDASVEIAKLADRACACKDVGCAKKVLDDFASFLASNQRTRGDEKKANEASARLGKCLVEKGVPATELRETLDAVMGEPK